MSLFNELKRRNVFRVGLAYLVSAWVIAQVAGLVLSSTTAPPWVMQVILLVLGLGFIIALIISWAYELTPEGLKKDADVVSDASIANDTGKKLNYITIVAALGVLGLFVFQQINPVTVVKNPAEQVNDSTTAVAEDSSKVNKVVDASIAVLPFVDLSPNKDQEYFSDGIAEEILNVLVRIKSLTVASRTSAFGFKGQEALGIPTIAQRLNVRHVLEGSVRKSGETVRITAQLIDAQTDAHLWSETFDRKLTTENIFAVQDEIASAIVKELGLMIGDDSTPQITVKKTTENLDAYELYLKAQGLFHVRSKENLLETLDLYEQAVAIDADFAEAWAGLANTYLVIPPWNLGSEADYSPKAMEAADRAIFLDDQLALPFAVKGDLAAKGGDIIAAIELMDHALELDPQNFQTIYIRSTVLLDLGYLNQAEAGFRQCLELDPSYAICSRFLSFVLLFQGELDEANALFEEGMLNGQSSYLNIFEDYYSAIKDRRAVSMILSVSLADAPVWVRKMYYRYGMESSFDLAALNAEIFNQTGGLTPEGEPNKKVTLEQEVSNVVFDFLWSPYHPVLRKPTMRAEYLRLRHKLNTELNLPYWQKYGFPPQCRAMGEDDFECDLNVYGEE